LRNSAGIGQAKYRVMNI